MIKNLIIISGTHASGKTTLAKFLSPAGHILSYADPIKQALATILWPGQSDWKGLIEANKATRMDILGGKTVRVGLQTLGTEWGRNIIYDQIWATSLIPRIEDCAADTCVVDDLRFMNEYKVVKEYFHEQVNFIHIHSNLNFSKGDVLELMSHESEQHVDALKAIADYVLTEKDYADLQVWMRLVKL